MGCMVGVTLSTKGCFLPLQGSCWRSRWHPTPVLLPGKSHGWRSLMGCSPWGCEESDITEQLPFHFLLSCIGEGNGNPLQCSCLENPRDGGSLVGCRLWGRTESDMTEVTVQQQCIYMESRKIVLMNLFLSNLFLQLKSRYKFLSFF